MNGERAQALVEFALVLPVLLVLAFGIVELSELGVARLALQHAASEGARTVALTNDDQLARSSIAAAAAPLDPRGVDVTVDPPEAQRGSDPRGTLIFVHLRYAIAAPVAFIGLPALIVRGEAARVMEWTP
ncbi:MAG TPA: TadE/TadG family type IV pilus assembly protein [Candidatus Limnocylindria bacterium]|nr:TadE/TadG family type IV pilus assembly protein [Candidatus Limnocylindria bacterium]